MNSQYGPETLKVKPGELLELAVDTSFEELNYAIDALKHAEGWDVPHGAIYAAEDLEGYVDILGSVWDKIPGWLVAAVRLPSGIMGKVASVAVREAKERLLAELKDRYQDSVREYYRPFTDRIPDHIRPYPALWETVLAGLREVSAPLGGTGVSFDAGSGAFTVGERTGSMNARMLDAQGCIGDWEGDFAEEVEFEYLNPLSAEILPNNLVAVHCLDGYGTALYHLATNKRRELSGIVDGVEDALNSLKDGDTADDLRKTMFVLSTVTGLVPGVVGAALDLAVAVPEQFVVKDPKPGDVNFASACPAHVITKLGRALTELEDNYGTQIDELAKAMSGAAVAIDTEVRGAVKENRRGVLTLHTPGIVAASGTELVDPDNLVPD